MARGGEAGDPRGSHDGMSVLRRLLGSQLLASALGSRVFRGPEPELGVNPVFLCEAARRDPVFRAFPPDVEVFEWHSDTFDLPEGAVRLARSPATKTRRFMSDGPRMRSSAIWSPRSTTSATGSRRGPRSGRHSRPVTDVALSPASWRSTRARCRCSSRPPSAVPPLAGEGPRPWALGIGCERRGNDHGRG